MFRRNSILCGSFLFTVASVAACAGTASQSQVTPRSSASPMQPTTAPSSPPEPDTARPSAAATEFVEGRYLPDSDPLNEKGWSFTSGQNGSPTGARGTQPFSLDAFYKIRYVTEPRWAPKGDRLLFVLKTDQLKKGKSNSDIYLMNADGSGLRQMTYSKSYDGDPRWAPDGKSFLFVSSRGGGTQLWRMSTDGGGPQKLTEVSTGIDSATWAPDGKSIAFISTVYPQCAADDACNKKAAKRKKDNPLKAHVADDLLFRHWTSYEDERRRHILLYDLASKKVRDLTPGDKHATAFAGGFTFAPDAKEICYTGNGTEGNAKAWTTNKDLFVVSLKEGAKAINLTASNPAYDGDPRYSPDGTRIAFRRQAIPGYESDVFRLAIYHRQTGKTRLLTSEYNDWVLDYAWGNDNTSIVFKGAAHGRFPLFQLNVETGALQRLAIPSVHQFALSSTNRLVFTHSQVDQPGELILSNGDGTQAKRVTYFNRKIVETYDLRPVEEAWVAGAGGRKVHVFIVKPHGFHKGKRYPLIINVHGGPQYQWSNSFRGDWQVYPAKGYVVAFFNPHGSIGYGQDYTRAISQDWAGKVYDDVMKVTDMLSELPYVDKKRMGAMGWSYGGYMMNWLLGHTDRFRAIASMMGIYDLVSFYGATEELWFPEWDLGGPPWQNLKKYRELSPSTYTAKFKTPTLIITGEKDYRVPYFESLQLFTALRRRGVPSRLVVFPNDGHWPHSVRSMPLYYAAHVDWFHRYLGGQPCPYKVEEMVSGTAFDKDEKPTSSEKER